MHFGKYLVTLGAFRRRFVIVDVFLSPNEAERKVYGRTPLKVSPPKVFWDVLGRTKNTYRSIFVVVMSCHLSLRIVLI